jgi:ferric-dicitrate binding protein FerR (iron transport regulator)
VVSQFNRYNWRQLRLADPGLASLRVGGAFKSTHLDEFTSALARLWGVRATLVTDPVSHEQVIELQRKPPGVR